MPVCHQCPHYPDVQAGKYDGVSFSKVPCSRCRFTGDARVRHIAGKDVVVFDGSYAEGVAATPEPVEDDGPDIPASMRTFFQEWVRLSPLARDAFAMKLSDPALTYADIASRFGVTTQAVHVAIHVANRRICRISGLRSLVRRNRKNCT